MPSNRVLLSLGKDRSTEKIGWHKRTGPYDDGYIETIVDPANAPLKRVLTAIPSPFARLHLFDAAFAFANIKRGKRPDHGGTSEYHAMVSDCLDVLELLWSSEDQATPFKLERWTEVYNLQALKKSPEPGQQLLGETLELYLSEDGKTANFDLQPVFYTVVVEGEVLALSSPLTIFVAAPGARELAERKKLMLHKEQQPFFTTIRPLDERSHAFQLYVHGLFANHPEEGGALQLSKLCRNMAQYVVASGEIARLAEGALSKNIRALQTNPQAPAATLELKDTGQEAVTILGHKLLKAPSTVRGRLAESPIAIRSPRLPAGAPPPIVWTGETDSYGNQQAEVPALPSELPKIEDRVLPDLNAQYPFVCASDFLEDKLVRLPFLPNRDQFHIPAYVGFVLKDKDGKREYPLEVSFLLPLKPAFFQYFPPEALAGMATFRRLPESDGIAFELQIPTGNKTLLFQKNYFKSPQQSRNGRIVDANLNVGLFPFLSVKGRPEFSDNYWAMLIDGERQLASRQQNCFQLRFTRLTPEGARPFVEGQNAAPLRAAAYVRCGKSLDAGSTYTRLRGGRCDLISVDCFAFDSERQTTGVIAPNWPEQAVGTRKARIAIDFGTTNSHMAILIEGERPDPQPFRVSAGELQVALLNDPNRPVQGGIADYDTFPSQLVSTGIRLHHEFVPSVIGPESVFHFPLRTATSEQPNLKLGEFRALQNINISFVHGLEAPRSDEHIKTNLKWTLDDPMMTERVEAFIEELLLLARTRLLMSDVDPEQVTLIWFRPLSFTPYLHNEFREIWKKKAESVLRMPPARVMSLTESEAPYFYFRFQEIIRTSQPTVCIDIGGGSTDVVFFDGKEPQFGTSFSFAGNALWGSGYSTAPGRDTSLARAVARAVEQRMKANKATDDAYRALCDSGAPMHELMNFCFGRDAQLHVTEALSRNSGIKCLALVHYAAILYHCAQLMKAKGLVTPEHLCFSGRGSQYLSILEKGETKPFVAALSQAIFEYVYGAKAAVPVSLRFAGESKEATCNGGLLRDVVEAHGAVATAPNVKPEVEVGTGVSTAPLRVEDIDGKIKGAVAANVESFVSMLVELSQRDHMDLDRHFGIAFEPAVVKAALAQKVPESIQHAVEERHRNPKPGEKISETLFFYALVQNLYELANRLL